MCASSKRTLRIAAFFFVCAFALLRPFEVVAQENQVNTAAAGLTGSVQVGFGAEVQIYSIELIDNNAGPPFNTVNLGNGVIGGINVQISDLTAPTGLAIADFTELRIYRSGDAIFNGGDTFMASAPVASVAGGNTTLDVTGLALGGNRLIPTTGIFFIITAVISPTATSGHAFRVGAAGIHVGFTESVFGNVQDGTPGIVAADGNNIVIAAQSPSFTSGVAGGGRGIPFGGEPAILIILLGSGLYMIRRASR
jgi:hypothetical protein